MRHTGNGAPMKWAPGISISLNQEVASNDLKIVVVLFPANSQQTVQRKGLMSSKNCSHPLMVRLLSSGSRPTWLRTRICSWERCHSLKPFESEMGAGRGAPQSTTPWSRQYWCSSPKMSGRNWWGSGPSWGPIKVELLWLKWSWCPTAQVKIKHTCS